MSRLGGRLVVLFVGLLMVPPFVYFGVKYVKAPVTYAGDVVEERGCRYCGGSGKDEGLAEDYPQFGDRCIACRGDGKVDVVVPGSLHPTRLRGVVFDSHQVDPIFGPLPITARPFEPTPGTIRGARIAITRDGGVVMNLETNLHGRFIADLKPGHYELRISAAGYEQFEEDLLIEPLTEPIWLEEANIIGDFESDDARRSEYGIDYAVPMKPLGSP